MPGSWRRGRLFASRAQRPRRSNAVAAAASVAARCAAIESRACFFAVRNAAPDVGRAAPAAGAPDAGRRVIRTPHSSLPAMWRIARSIAARLAPTSTSALSMDENMVNSFVGTTAAPGSREKCSITDSCAMAISETHSRSRSFGSRCDGS